MKIERLRKSHKKEIIIGVVLTVVIGGALTFKITHSKYRYTESIDLAEGVIHYKVPDFKVMAMYQQKDGQTCTEDDCYDELTGRMPSSGYVINETKSYCTLDNIAHDEEVKLYTENGENLFKNLKKSDKCYIWFDKAQITNVESLIANSYINIGSPDFSKKAITDEGIWQASDGKYGGMSYYWRGAATTNHVIFAEKCWRIVRINGDKTIRLIYNGPTKNNDGKTCNGNGENENSIAVKNQAYAVDGNTYNKSYYVGWTWDATNEGLQRPARTSGQETLTNEGTHSNARSQTESWYKTNITDKGFNDKVADGKFCNDRYVDVPPSSFNWNTTYTTAWNTNTGDNNRFAYAGAKRLEEDYSPTFSCDGGDVYTLKVGLITADEVEFAGGTGKNQLYYLYNGQDFWTMSPYYWFGTGYARMFYVRLDGLLSCTDVYTARGLRPVINLKSNITFSSGNGQQNSPYTVSN